MSVSPGTERGLATPPPEGSFYRGRRAAKNPPPERGAAPERTAGTALSARFVRAGDPTFRRRSVKPRRRGRLVRWLKPMATAVLLVGGTAGTLGWLVFSPRFRIAAIDVSGADPGLTGWVRERVAPLVGERLLVLSLSRVFEAVGEHPWIDSLEVSRRLPDRLSVVIRPRRPAAVVEIAEEVEGSRLVYADREGRRIAPVDVLGPGAPEAGALADLVRVAGGTGETRGVPEALAIRRELTRAQPAWGRGVTRVEVLDQGEFRLTTTALPFPLSVRAGTVESKVRWLEGLLPRLVDRWGEPAAVDLRFARRIVLERVDEVKSERSPARGA